MHITAHVSDLEIPLENRLLVGIEYSDGRRASTLGDKWAFSPGAEMASDELVLVPQGGGGSELAVDRGFWVARCPHRGQSLSLSPGQAWSSPERWCTTGIL